MTVLILGAILVLTREGGMVRLSIRRHVTDIGELLAKGGCLASSLHRSILAEHRLSWVLMILFCVRLGERHRVAFTMADVDATAPLMLPRVWVTLKLTIPMLLAWASTIPVGPTL